jgi:hypothetical protein
VAGTSWAQQESTQANPAILQIELAAECRTYRAGTRAHHPLVLYIQDEAGRPVSGAVVSIQFPAEAPTGAFPGGLHSEIVSTGEDGRAIVHGIEWSPISGLVQLRVTARKGDVRAGALLPIELIDREASPVGVEKGRSHRWIWIGVAAAGGLGASMALRRNGATAPAPAGAGAAAMTAPASTAIGPPIISVGRP